MATPMLERERVFTNLIQDLAERDRLLRRREDRIRTLEAEVAVAVEDLRDARIENAQLLNDLDRATQPVASSTSQERRDRKGNGGRP